MKQAFIALLIYCVSAGSVHAAEVGFAVLPLTAPVRTWELRDFSTVGSLADYLLHRVGYSLALAYPAPAQALDVARRPVNPGIYTHDVLTIEDILIYAIGPNNKLIIDVKNKLVSFEPVQGAFDSVNPNSRYFTGSISELRP